MYLIFIVSSLKTPDVIITKRKERRQLSGEQLAVSDELFIET